MHIIKTSRFSGHGHRHRHGSEHGHGHRHRHGSEHGHGHGQGTQTWARTCTPQVPIAPIKVL